MPKTTEAANLYWGNNSILNDYVYRDGDLGELSDGYHTFNSLYHQRAILFATIVNMNRDKSWKSKKHSNGKYCFDREGEWFIVGIDTPKGSYTYHYETDKYWNLFNCEELELGKERDGHTEKDVDRLLSLGDIVEQLKEEKQELEYLGDINEELKEENKKLKEEVKDLLERIAELSRELKARVEQVENLRDTLKKITKENERLKSKLEQTVDEYDEDYKTFHRDDDKCFDENFRKIFGDFLGRDHF